MLSATRRRPPPQASRVAGGWAFLADPEVRADRQPIFWRPELDAATVLLTTCPTDHAATAISFNPEAWPGETLIRPAEDGVYVLVQDGRVEHRAWLHSLPATGTRLAALLPLNPAAPFRAEATARFWRHLEASRAVPVRRKPGRRIARLAAALRALDGRLAGASYRDIAEVMFGGERLRHDPWKTASVRDTTIRLVRSGIGLMRGGCRTLLGPQRLE